MPLLPPQEFGAAYSNAATSEYPSGSYKDETVPGSSRDGSPLVAVTENDRLGFDYALAAEVGMAFTNVPDTAVSSQRLTAHKRLIDRNVSKTTFATVANMINGTDINGNTVDLTQMIGSRVTWSGYYTVSDGGGNWGIVTAGSHTEDGGSVFSINATTYVRANLKGKAVDVRKFGAIADNGTTDNRVPFQNVINYAEVNGNTIRIGETPDADAYGINSFNPDTVSRNGNVARKACLVISDPTNMKIEGFRDRNANIRYYGTETGDALLYIDAPTAKWGLTVDGLGLDANNKLDYCIHASDGAQLANVRFNGGCYVRPVLDCIKMAAYMVTMSRVLFSDVGRYGLHFAGNFDNDTDGETTSLNVENCWVRLVGEAGYKVSNDLWYSTFNATGCDGLGNTGAQYRPRWAFDFYRARGVSLISCGAENCDSYLNSGLHFGLEIESPVGIGLGATTGTVPAIIQLGGDGGCTLSNLPYGFDLFTGADYTVEINKLNSRTRLDIVGNGINRARVNVTNESNDGWADTVYYSSGSGYTVDRGYNRLNDTCFVGEGLTIEPRSTTSNRYTIERKGAVVNNSGVVTVKPVQLLDVVAGTGGTIVVEVEVLVNKIAGSPSPAVSSTKLSGSTIYRSAVGYDSTMLPSDSTTSVTGSLVWNGTILELQHNSQWAFNIIDMKVHSLVEGIYVETLI